MVYFLNDTLKQGVFLFYRRHNLKRFLTASTLSVLLVSCSAASYSDNHIHYDTPTTSNQALPGFSLMLIMEENQVQQTMIEQQVEKNERKQKEEARIQEVLNSNKDNMDSSIILLKSYIGKTWYVFSGSSPSGWDCSGLVRWYYEQLGIEVPHSANKQGLLKPKVIDPKPGDIVVFKYKNSNNYHHSAIYIGNNKVIHAGFKSGDMTEIISLDAPSFSNNDINFVRLIERN